MFWLIRFTFKFVIKLRLVLFSMLAGMGMAYCLQLRDQRQSWGIVPEDVQASLPGDELVPAPCLVDTRTLKLDATPAEVWPWLVQMGWGRGGWYSYDQLGPAGGSADSILEEHQHLAEGDVVPTHPGGGFVARVVDPGRALVLYLDSELIQRQMAETAIDDTTAADGSEGERAAWTGAAGRGRPSMPDIRISWAIVLEADGGGTRLIERYRAWSSETGLTRRLGLPLAGMGMFAMTRKHMLGLKARVEGLSGDGASAAAADTAEA